MLGVRLAPASIRLPLATPPDRRRFIIRAEITGEDVKQGKGVRWNAFKSRWEKADPAKSVFKQADMPTVITPMTGEAYTIWPVMYQILVEKKLRSVNCEEAAKLTDGGRAVVVDVRTIKEFTSKRHIEGAINVPLFRSVQGTGLADIAKKIAMAGLFMEATERNPNFAAELKAAVPRGKTAILCCQSGGSLADTVEPTPLQKARNKRAYKDGDRAFGRESRSLKAAYEAYEAGYNNILHLEGGNSRWSYEGWPMEPDN